MDSLFKALPRDLQWEILENFVGTHIVRNGRLRRKLIFKQYFSANRALGIYNYFGDKNCLKIPPTLSGNGRYLNSSMLDKAYIYGRENGCVVDAFVFLNIGILAVFRDTCSDEISYGYCNGKTSTVLLFNGNYCENPPWTITKIPELPERYMNAFLLSQQKLSEITNEEWDFNRRNGGGNQHLMITKMAERVQIERDMPEIHLPELTLDELVYYSVQLHKLPKYIKRVYPSYPFSNKKLGRKCELMKLYWYF